MQRGTLKVEVNGQIRHLQPGERITIPQGAPHQWWNEGDEEANLLVTFSPALNTETFLEQFFGLCNNGKTSADGTPNFLQLMAMVNEYDLYVAGPPLPIQKLMGIVLGGFARLIGLKKFYPKFSEQMQNHVNPTIYHNPLWACAIRCPVTRARADPQRPVAIVGKIEQKMGGF